MNYKKNLLRDLRRHFPYLVDIKTSKQHMIIYHADFFSSYVNITEHPRYRRYITNIYKRNTRSFKLELKEVQRFMIRELALETILETSEETREEIN